jgi:hypothetical protein
VDKGTGPPLEESAAQVKLEMAVAGLELVPGMVHDWVGFEAPEGRV